MNQGHQSFSNKISHYPLKIYLSEHEILIFKIPFLGKAWFIESSCQNANIEQQIYLLELIYRDEFRSYTFLKLSNCFIYV